MAAANGSAYGVRWLDTAFDGAARRARLRPVPPSSGQKNDVDEQKLVFPKNLRTDSVAMKVFRVLGLVWLLPFVLRAEEAAVTRSTHVYKRVDGRELQVDVFLLRRIGFMPAGR